MNMQLVEKSLLSGTGGPFFKHQHVSVEDTMGLTSENLPEWKKLARAKRSSQLASIPAEWRLPEMESQPQNTLAYLRTSGILSPSELEITETIGAAALLERIRSRRFAAVDVIRAYSKRAALAHQLVGCCTEIFFAEALERARGLDKHLESTGQCVGPLHGLPISLKDLFNVKGQDTTWGWVGLIDQPAQENCTLVDVLIAQGAVPYVKTNLSQSIMMADSYNHVFKQSLNSLNSNLISGGSSGGEAALVGCLGSPVGFGSDTGGSIRVPSASQGVFGLCPTAGRLPFDDTGKRMFIAPPVSGPIGSSLSSVETVMEGLLAGKPWDHDPVVAPLPWRRDLAELPRRPLRIGYYLDDGAVKPQPPLQHAVALVVEHLKTAGHEVFEWDASSHKELTQYWGRAIMSDGGDIARKHASLSGEPLIEGMIIGGEDDRLTSREMEELVEIRTQQQREYLHRWRDAKVDALITPVQTCAGFRPREWIKSYQYVGYTAVWNWLGFTGLTMPVTTISEENSCGDESWTTHTPRNISDKINWETYEPNLVMGMPVGIQIVGGRFGEEKAISVAKVVQEALGNS